MRFALLVTLCACAATPAASPRPPARVLTSVAPARHERRALVDCGGEAWSVEASVTPKAGSLVPALPRGALWLWVKNCGSDAVEVEQVVVRRASSSSGYGVYFAHGVHLVPAGSRYEIVLEGPLGDGDARWEAGSYTVRVVAISAPEDGGAHLTERETSTTFAL